MGQSIKESDMLTKILPALRGLMADQQTLPCLKRVSPTGQEPVVSIPPGCPDVLAELRKHLPAGAKRVTVDTLGTYEAGLPAQTHGRAAGKVAVVTGAAQGFGFEIAADLAAQGAWVALADINVDGVTAAAAKINAACGREAAIGVTVNVADIDSLTAALEQVVAAFGGVDLFVANAGVLRAGSVKELSVKDLDFVTNVNYKGYFLSV
ncbi:MAG: SDR family NAD(P)-dependent oxidoreductase, partial [bacterium]